MRVWFLRHQAAGVLYEYVFTDTPGDAQLAPIRAMLKARYGDAPSRTAAPYWTKLICIETLGRDEAPRVDMPDASSVPNSGGELAGLKASGAGTVLNP